MQRKAPTMSIKKLVARNAKLAATQMTAAKKDAAESFAHFHETTPFDDVHTMAFAPVAPPAPVAPVAEMMMAMPSATDADVDPMVSFVASTIEMQQKHADQIKEASEEQAKQCEMTTDTLRRSIRLASAFHRRQQSTFEKDAEARKDAERRRFHAFAEGQKASLKDALRGHIRHQKCRLTKFQKCQQALVSQKQAAQEGKFSESLVRVAETLQKHESAMGLLASGLKRQQEATRELKLSIERKSAAALGLQTSASKATVSAIHDLGCSLKKDQAKCTSAMSQTIQKGADGQNEAVKVALKAHSKEQIAALHTKFQQQQQSQLRGLKAAVMQQKAQQQSQLSGLRDALEARRRTNAALPAPAGRAALPTVGISSTLALTSGAANWGARAVSASQSARAKAAVSPAARAARSKSNMKW